MNSELPADVARCPGADAVWCDHCRRREEEASALRAEIDQMKANAARQNKLMHLASKDIVFFGGFFYDPSDRAFRVPRPLVLCNDFFAPAADCEEFEPEDIDAIHDAYLQFGDAGVLAWVSLKRGGENPWRMKPGSELIAQFETAREAMRLNIPPGYREPAPVDFMGSEGE